MWDLYTQSVCTGWRMEVGQQDLRNKVQSRGARWASFRQSGSVGTSGSDISSQIWSLLRDYLLEPAPEHHISTV